MPRRHSAVLQSFVLSYQQWHVLVQSVADAGDYGRSSSIACLPSLLQELDRGRSSVSVLSSVQDMHLLFAVLTKRGHARLTSIGPSLVDLMKESLASFEYRIRCRKRHSQTQLP